jgi:hypothetical protein
MRAIEATGTIDHKGNLSLEQPVDVAADSRVRVIILYAEEPIAVSPQDPDDTPLEEVKASLRRALAESKAGQRIPIAQMWEEADPAV